VYSGSPGGPVTLALRVPRVPEPEWAPIGIDVDGDRLLLSELRARDGAARARVLVPGAAPWTVPWPGRALTPAAIAGERVAFLASTRPGRRARLDRVFVADWHSGAVEAILDIDDPDTLDREGNGMDLAPDGRVVATSSSRLLTVAPGVPQAVIPGAARRSLPRFAGARIVALEAGRFDARAPVVLDAGGRSTRLGAPSTALERIAADERGAAWIANGCVRYAPLDGSTPAVIPAACPSGEVLLEDHDQTLHGRTFRIAVTCVAAAPPGCRGTALLRAGGVRARGRFAVPPGAKRLVRVRLTRRGLRWARAALRRRGEAGLRLTARMPDGRFPLDRHGSSVFLTVDPELRG
jgi:hypothetical protein